MTPGDTVGQMSAHPASVTSTTMSPAANPAVGQPRTGTTGTPKSSKRPTVLFIGTSLTAGYGVQPDQAYPAVIGRLADSAGYPITVVNAGVSGETSSGALHRIDWVLRTPADIIVLETGANDALRALSTAAAKANISAILDKIHTTKPGAPVLLLQMEAPPNLGPTYTSAFHALYPDLATEKHVALAPFFLKNVAGHADLNQPDGVHPNPTGAKVVGANVWNALEPIVQSFEKSSSN